MRAFVRVRVDGNVRVVFEWEAPNSRLQSDLPLADAKRAAMGRRSDDYDRDFAFVTCYLRMLRLNRGD